MRSGYKGYFVDPIIDKVVAQNRTTLLSKSRADDKSERVIFVTTYNPRMMDIRKVHNNHMPILELSDRMQKVFPSSPLIALRRPSNLGDVLIQTRRKLTPLSLDPSRSPHLPPPLPPSTSRPNTMDAPVSLSLSSLNDVVTRISAHGSSPQSTNMDEPAHTSSRQGLNDSRTANISSLHCTAVDTSPLSPRHRNVGPSEHVSSLHIEGTANTITDPPLMNASGFQPVFDSHLQDSCENPSAPLSPSMDNTNTSTLTQVGHISCGNNRCLICRLHRIEGPTVESCSTGKRYRLKNILDCNSHNVIYSLTCSKCNVQYVGKTQTKLRTRFNNHKSTIRKRGDGTVDLHFNLPGHDISDIRLQAIDKCNLDNIMTRETWWIHRLKSLTITDGLNVDCGVKGLQASLNN